MNIDTNKLKSECQVCGQTKTNWYYGAIVCEACKKFFMRSHKENHYDTYECNGNSSSCSITVTSRTRCQRCRYEKCIAVGMNLNSKLPSLLANSFIKNTKCVICSATSSGIHFGVFSCEACKAFFRRSLKNNLHKQYECETQTCIIIYDKRACRFCRFKKCVDSGMLSLSTQMGRQSNIFKHEIFNREAKRKAEIDNDNPSRDDDECSQWSKRPRLQAETLLLENESSISFSPNNTSAFQNYPQASFYNSYHQYNVINQFNNFHMNLNRYQPNMMPNNYNGEPNDRRYSEATSTTISSIVNQDELNEINAFLNQYDWRIHVLD